MKLHCLLHHYLLSSPLSLSSSFMTHFHQSHLPRQCYLPHQCHHHRRRHRCHHIHDHPQENSTVRLVCRRLNELCAARLNSTFNRLQNNMLVRFQTIKVSTSSSLSTSSESLSSSSSSPLSSFFFFIVIMMISPEPNASAGVSPSKPSSCQRV